VSRARRPARRVLIAIGAVLIVLIAAAAWLGVRGLTAQRELVAAADELQQARTALVDRRLDAAGAAVDAAGERTGRARDLTGDPVWRLASGLPRVGDSLATARGLAVAADDVARGVLVTALEAADQVDPAALRGPDGAIDLDMLRAATPAVVSSSEQATEVRADLAQLPVGGAVEAVAKAEAELSRQVDGLADTLVSARQALEAAPLLLGADGPRRYLVLIQQTSESRGTGGLIGGFVEVVAEGGRLSVASQGSNADLENGYVAPPPSISPEFLQLYEHRGVLERWQQVNASPDLPVVADLIESRWVAQGGAPLDGVVMVDAIALAHVLQGAGPVTVGERQVAPDDLAEYLAVGQYADFAPADPADSLGRAAARKDQLEDLGRAVALRLTSGGGDSAELLRGVVAAVRSGHLRVSADDPELAAVLADAGVDGALPRGEAPVAYPVVFNYIGGKLDYFLDRRITYTAGPCEGARRRSTITVELTNRAPEAGLPPYLTVRYTREGLTSSTVNGVMLSVYGTRGAELVRASLDGVVFAPVDPQGPPLQGAEEAGLPLWRVQAMDLPAGVTRRLVLELDEPVVPGAARVPEQPLARPLLSQVDVPTCS
jgi:hypothetical protein